MHEKKKIHLETEELMMNRSLKMNYTLNASIHRRNTCDHNIHLRNVQINKQINLNVTSDMIICII